MDLYDFLDEAARRASAAKDSLSDAAGKWVEDAKQNVSTAVTKAGVRAEAAVSGAVSSLPGPVAQFAETYVSGATSSTATVATTALIGAGVPLSAAQVVGAGVGGGTAVLPEALSGTIELASQGLIDQGIGGQTDTEIVNIAQQCYLIYNIEAFSTFHQKLLSNSKDPWMPTPAFYAPLRSDDIDTLGYTDGRNQKIYLTSTEESSFLVNKFGMKKHGDLFAIMKTPEIAQLVPRLRIYKVYRENGQTTDKKVEFEFAAGNNADFYTAPQDTQPFPNAPKEFVRGMDVGVESFSWRFIGDDPFMATRFVEAELKLTGQTMQAFFYQRTSNNVLPRNSTKSRYRYLDLILQPDCRRNRTNSQVWQTYSPECYEVQVEVGYNGSNKNFGTFEDDGQFREAINAQTEILRLGVQEHKFDFKEDGSVGLTIKFKGFLELFAKDKSMNILLPYAGMANNLIKVDLSEVSAGIINKYGFQGVRKNGFVSLVDADELLVILRSEKEDEEIKRAKEEIENQISKILVSSKQALMSHLLDRLETNNAVYTYFMTGGEERAFGNWKFSEKITLPNKTTVNRVAAGGETNLPTPATAPGDFTDATSGVGEASARRISIKLGAQNQEELNSIVNSGLENAFESSALANFFGGNRVVNYFFLGDLIAVIMDSITGQDSFDFSTQGFYFDVPLVGTDSYLGRLALDARERVAPADVLALGALPVSNSNLRGTPGIVLDQIRVILGDLKFSFKGTTDEVSINIANVPISVESFNQFMIDNVLSKDINNYPFFDFIDDLVKALVTDFLGTKCFGGLTEANVNPQTAVFHSTKELSKDGRGTYYKPEKAPSRADYNVIHTSEIKKENPLFNTTKIHQTDKMYFLFGASSLNPKEMNGDYDADMKSGIFHLAHGIDRGLVKSMSFEKVNQEFVAEAVFASEGGTILSQLANKFDVTIEMVGNNLFRNGQYIYINAESFGGGPSYYDDGQGEDRKRSWANIMGLGGYHIITAVDNTISADGTFKTTLKARWETGGTLPPGNNS